ncbi:MAG: DUF2249 domain-containing protein, partial [Mycobacteriales bacterium]
MSLDTVPDATETAAADEGPRSAPSPTNDSVIVAIRAHHAQLADELRRGTEAVLNAVRSGNPTRERAELHDWYRTELLPHAVAEERALYGPGEELAATRLLVRGMIAEHRQLESLVADLGLADNALDVAIAAAAAHSLFVVHLGKENDLLLPALDRAGLDLGAILEGMHEILGHAAAGTPDAEGGGCGCGCGCGHDDAAAPLQIGVAEDTPDGDLDVRTLPHAQRHEIIFGRLDRLEPGQALVILNDHDPK